MVHGYFTEQFGSLKLGLEQVFLIAHSRAITGVRCLLDLLEYLSVALQNSESLGEVGKPKIGRFDSRKNGTANGFVFLLRNVSLSLRNFALKPKFAGIRKVLRNSQTDVSEVAVRIPRKWTRASDIDLLQIELRVGKRRDL